MIEKEIIYEIKDSIGHLVFNKPEKMNILDEKYLHELDLLIETIKKDPEVKILIIKGRGKAFISGADIRTMIKKNYTWGQNFSIMGQNIFQKLENLEIPTIALIHGYALGGGCELSLCCDFRICSENAKFGLPEVKLGLIPGFGGTQRLTRIVGPSKAKELIYTGKIINANTALEIGLVNMVVPSVDLMNQAMDLANLIKENGPIAIKYAKKAINTGLERGNVRGYEIESELFGKCFTTKDKEEGIKAFLDRRKPIFKND